MTAPLTESRLHEIRANPACATHDEVRALCGMALDLLARGEKNAMRHAGLYIEDGKLVMYD